MNKEQSFSDVCFTKQEEIFLKLVKLSTQYLKITINIAEFCDILGSYKLQANNNIFQPITEREVLRKGFYGRLNGMEIYVSKTVAPGEFVAEDAI